MVDDSRYAELELKPAAEDADVQEIVRTILITQQQNAKEQKKPLMRGTHAKGVALRAEFEVLDVAADRDPALASRLAQGIFAHPGVYPAIVRFANAEAREYPDSRPDLRAMSFWIEAPAGVVGPEAKRLDFSLQTASTFTINDPHAFAVLMRVLAAPSAWKKLKVLWRLPLADLGRLFSTLGRAVRQQRGTPKRAYQQLRYWSTVPFRHGTEGAAKYSATPGGSNPGNVDWSRPNGLREELARHVNHDDRMAEFDFGVQLLDVDEMTRFGRKRPAEYWVENAAVEWSEQQAPFHTVARLRLAPKSVLTAEETAAQHIDVNTNSLPETKPIGGINRARWAAEVASRTARQGGKVDLPAEVPIRRSIFASAARAAALIVLPLIALWYTGRVAYWWMERDNVPPLEPVAQYRYLDQGWGTDQDAPNRELYYYTPQGASLLGIRYSWLKNLERPFTSERLADPDHMRQLNFIVDQAPTRSNPDWMPVGVTRRFDPTVQDYVVDLTCAACHTGQIHITRAMPGRPDLKRTTAIRIDGGQSMIAFTDVKVGSFLVEVAGSLATTLANPLKFNRFANRVLGDQATFGNKFLLWREVAGVAWAGTAHKSFLPHWYPTQEGFGRTDAIARISNVVFGDHMTPDNYRIARGPTSFPFLWDIWKFDWEQYGAFVAQPMARNIGEALGTGADYVLVDDYGRSTPPAERYRTTFSLENGHRIEGALQRLKSPTWPADLLGGIDLDKAAKGRKLFVEHCQGCHGPKAASPDVVRQVSPGRVDPPLPLWEIQAHALAEIGTDPESATDLATFRLDASRTGLEPSAVVAMLGKERGEELKRAQTLLAQLESKALPSGDGAGSEPAGESYGDLAKARKNVEYVKQQIAALDKLDVRALSIGEGLNILGMVIRERYYRENHYSEEAQACFNGFGMLDLPAANLGYKARPLEGVWATPPFLHNGSVPTIYHLLSPAQDRPTYFYVGSREYDPLRLGYVVATERDPGAPPSTSKLADAAVQPRRGEFRFDTKLRGNSNRGHEFNDGYVPFDPKKPVEEQYQNGLIGPRLREDEKMAIIEYLKVHRDDGPEVVEYMQSHGGQYPPQQKYQMPDCFALLGK
jgi:hypothetical protein